MERIGVNWKLLIVLCLNWTQTGWSAGTNSTAPLAEPPTIIIVVGAAGETDFGIEFAKAAELWRKAGETAQAQPVLIGLTPTNTSPDLAQLKQTLLLEPTNALSELWLILIGHGTFDGKEARFNLRGPDLTASELAEWLQPFRRPIIVINCASASGPFIQPLSAPNRVIVTATRSGSEENYARFGQYIATAIADPQADLDKDDQTSLLEAFLLASRQVSEFYAAAGRLQTEHALLDDNGDRLGTPADFFRGVQAIKKPTGGNTVDGSWAQQLHLVRSREELALPAPLRNQREALEQALNHLRAAKQNFNEPEYYERLERLLLQLAKIYTTPAVP